MSRTTIRRAAYDGDGARRKRLDSQGTIHYLGPYEKKMCGGADGAEVVTKLYYATLGPARRLIALRRGGILYYVGTDHLGSTIRVTDAAFQSQDQALYHVYGASRNSGMNLQTDHRLTGQILDASLGLYWYGSRAYDPTIGRFVVPQLAPLLWSSQFENRSRHPRRDNLHQRRRLAKVMLPSYTNLN